MAMGLESKTSEKPSEETRIRELQKELEKTRDVLERNRIRQEILAIKRSYNRTMQFSKIQENPIIKENTSLDNLSPARLLLLDKNLSGERRGEFLSKSFLYKRKTDSEGVAHEEPLKIEEIGEGDTLFVDFGENDKANRKIGLGQMLPASIEYIKVGSEIGVRTIINNRVGYYNAPTALGYIPVFTGNTVTIPSKDEIASFEKNMNAVGLSKNTDRKANDDANDAYLNKLEHTSIDAVEVNTYTRESYKFWISNGFTHEQACGLLANEYAESGFNPQARGDGGKAHGIFQWHPERRDAIKKSIGIDISVASHEEQLKAALWEMKEGNERNVYPAVKGANGSKEVAEIFTRLFERPADIEGESLKRGQMAEAFSILLDEKGRSTNLGDHVVKRGPANLGQDSCGAAVRELLKSYGITGLPESGADGKKWENILNERPSQFVKMKISHPDYAYPGAILVYNGNGTLGSEANKDFGHVEIKGSDGKYYSYYESSMAAGSAKSGEKDPQKYAEQTGFIGYAYYPKQTI